MARPTFGKIAAAAFLIVCVALLDSCDDCGNCIDGIMEMDMPQEDGSTNCLYFGESEKFIFNVPADSLCPNTLRIRREALQYKGIMGLTFIDESLIAGGTVFYNLPDCLETEGDLEGFEFSTGLFLCSLLYSEKAVP